jgi:integrase
LKTEKSRRTLIVPTVCLNALRVHRKRQLKERLKAGANWIDSGLVVTTFRSDKGNKIGAGLHPRNVLRTLGRIITSANAGIPQVRFHDLRHSAASLLIAEGIELVEVSMRARSL